MEKLPYKLFFDSLVQTKMQMNEIIAKLQDFGLTPFPSSIDDAIQVSLREFKNKYPTQDTWPREVKNMVNHLTNLPIVLFHELFDLVNDIVMRKWIQTLLLGNFDISTIYVLVSSKSERLYNEESFRLYNQYFFDLRNFTIKDKYNLVQSEKDARLLDVYRISLNHDREELLWKLGFTPDLSIEYIVKNIAAESMMRFKTTTDDDKASKLGTLALRAAEKLKELDIDKKKDLETLAGFDFNVLQESPKFKNKKELEEN